jgi:hypothetical protein
VVSAISGGDFRSGFLAGSFGAAGDVMGLTDMKGIEGVTVSAVIGGTGSVLGGGKFAQGAMTSIIGTLKNSWDGSDFCSSDGFCMIHGEEDVYQLTNAEPKFRWLGRYNFNWSNISLDEAINSVAARVWGGVACPRPRYWLQC